jgi:hypothetical protein
MKMKKRITVLLAALMILTVLIPAVPVLTLPVQAASVGELIEFGGREWRVLDVQGRYTLIITENTIGRREYHTIWERANWETSTLRQWLNGEFLNDFSAEDRARIRETYVINSDNPWGGDLGGGPNTTDRVFLLSLDELGRFFGGSGLWADPSRPDFHPWVLTDGHDSTRIARDAGGNGTAWWLRTPGGNNHHAVYVDSVGRIVAYGTTLIDPLKYVRPALWLRLDDNDTEIETVTITASVSGGGHIEAEVDHAEFFIETSAAMPGRPGHVARLQAIPHSGWAFDGWFVTGAPADAVQEYGFPLFAFYISADRSLEARFVYMGDNGNGNGNGNDNGNGNGNDNGNGNGNGNGTFTLTVTTDGGGTVFGSGRFNQGERVTARAVADSGFGFYGWFEQGRRAFTNAEYSFNIMNNRTLQAQFLDRNEIIHTTIIRRDNFHELAIMLLDLHYFGRDGHRTDPRLDDLSWVPSRIYINSRLVFCWQTAGWVAEEGLMASSSIVRTLINDYHSFRVEHTDGRVIVYADGIAVEYTDGDIVTPQPPIPSSFPLIPVLMGIIGLLLIVIIIIFILLVKKKKKEKE